MCFRGEYKRLNKDLEEKKQQRNGADGTREDEEAGSKGLRVDDIYRDNDDIDIDNDTDTDNDNDKEGKEDAMHEKLLGKSNNKSSRYQLRSA
jgi:hypothetical protein